MSVLVMFGIVGTLTDVVALALSQVCEAAVLVTVAAVGMLVDVDLRNADSKVGLRLRSIQSW